MIKSLRLPKSSNQLQFLIQRVPLGRISNALSIPPVVGVGVTVVVVVENAVTFPSILRGNPPMKTSIIFLESGTIVDTRFNPGNLSHICLEIIPLHSQMVKFVFHLLDLSWAKDFYQDRASSVKVPVANFTLQSSVQFLRENTNLVRSNQRISLTAPSEPLKLKVCASKAAVTLSAIVYLLAS
ncbi:hypothetical protein Tco_1477175 [Tanacetum coccineum]